MRVLQVGPCPPPIGGVQTNVFAIREALVRRNIHCEIVAVPKSREVIEEPHVHHPSGGIVALIRLLRQLPADITHLHIGGAVEFRAIGIIFLIALFARGKKVLTFHSGGFVISPRGENPRPYSILGFLFRRFDRVISVNSKMMEMFRGFKVREEKLAMIYPFNLELPDPDVSLPGNIQEYLKRYKRIILSVNLLEPEYDIGMQVDALGRVLEEFPDTGLLIIGGGGEEESLRQRIAATAWSGNVLLAGEVSRKCVIHLLARADIMIRTTRYDGDAISIREATFLGAQVIATDTGLRPAGVDLVPIGDAERLANRACSMLKDMEDGKLSRSTTPPQASNENIEQVVDLYKEIA